MTGQEIAILQGGLWSGIFFLLYLMRRDRHEPTPDFVQATLLLIGFVVSILLLAMWLL